MRRDLIEALRCPATGSPLQLVVHETSDTDVTFGILEAATESYPVLAGVPVLLPGLDDAVEEVRAGRYAAAAATALWHDLPASARGRVARAFGLFGRAEAVARRIEAADRRRLHDALGPLLAADAPDPLGLIRLGFEGWGSPNPEAVGYFTYRFGTPRHLVSLAVADAVDIGTDGVVLDLGCGAGHLTWGLGQMLGPERTISVDLSLAELWAARGIAGPVDLICGDATALPLRSDAFDLVLSSDVLSFVHQKWSAAREAMRVAKVDGTIAITAVKNALTDHVYAGMPLPPEGWRALFDPLDAHVLADRKILDDYLDGRRLRLVDDHAPDEGARRDVDGAPTVTVLAGRTGPRLREPGPFTEWPHGIGPLGINPLLHPVATTGHPTAGRDLVFERRWPTERFAPDNPPLDQYLPATLTLPADARTGDQLDRAKVEAHLASTAVLALPDLYRVDIHRADLDRARGAHATSPAAAELSS